MTMRAVADDLLRATSEAAWILPGIENRRYQILCALQKDRLERRTASRIVEEEDDRQTDADACDIPSRVTFCDDVQVHEYEREDYELETPAAFMNNEGRFAAGSPPWESAADDDEHNQEQLYTPDIANMRLVTGGLEPTERRRMSVDGTTTISKFPNFSDNIVFSPRTSRHSEHIDHLSSDLLQEPVTPSNSCRRNGIPDRNLSFFADPSHTLITNFLNPSNPTKQLTLTLPLNSLDYSEPPSLDLNGDQTNNISAGYFSCMAVPTPSFATLEGTLIFQDALESEEDGATEQNSGS